MSNKDAYKGAGVDIEAGNRAVELMSGAVRSTYGPEVLLGIGAFGGLYDAQKLAEFEQPVLVASTDGVGTKTAVAAAIGSYETLGQDIVNHCIDDILVQGAHPLFFLDYVAAPALDPETIAAVVSGVAKACRAAGCAILGGETAEMPGVYAPGQMDVVGTIVGLVERDAVIDGTSIAPGDAVLGLPSVGLHTNGFSLVRSIFEPTEYTDYIESLGRTLGEALVEPHHSYLPEVDALRQVVEIKGLAHITGGGFYDNVPRILPKGTSVVLDRSSWPVLPIFRLIQERGDIAEDEMYHVFNMGVSLVVVLPADQVAAAQKALERPSYLMGEVVASDGESEVTFV